ncbi:MAG: cupin domain-containing protein [Candidatus Omnitrophica bacterium]|nr:cupin domain-containing protein [Candidatus Omnitrophota bacterium]
MKIRIEKLSFEELKRKDVFNWPTWEKEVSEFPWHYNETEECYFLEGEVEIKFKEGNVVKIGKGDFVTFPKGLFCVWKVVKPVKKHYNFK